MSLAIFPSSALHEPAGICLLSYIQPRSFTVFKVSTKAAESGWGARSDGVLLLPRKELILARTLHLLECLYNEHRHHMFLGARPCHCTGRSQ